MVDAIEPVSLGAVGDMVPGVDLLLLVGCLRLSR